MRRRRLVDSLAIAALLAGVLSVFGPRAGLAGAASPVPAEYAELYPALAAKLKAADGAIISR